jgi:hypothetical protein
VPHREPFDHKRPLVAARDFTFAGEKFKPGEPFPKPGTPPDYFARRLIERQYNAHAVNHAADDAAEADDAPKMVPGPQNGRYTITAPWLDAPLVVRGKVNAETEFAKIKEEGAPLGWIAGGTKVEVEQTGGGWYQITAPWLAEPEKAQGREAAETRQREIHAAGEPDNYLGVTLTAGENGWYVITRDGVETELKVHGEEQAREAAATLRAGGTVEGDPLPPEQEGDAGAEQGQQGDKTGTDGAPGTQNAEQAADANSANAGTADGAATGAAEQGGPDGAKTDEGAENGAEGKDDAEAGKSKDKPADA